MKKVLIVLSSVRKNRVADKVLGYIESELKNYPDYQATVADFSKTPLPFFDSELSPSSENYAPEAANVKNWIKQVNEADAVIIVAAEYNHSYTAVIKNAIDWVPGSVWQDKKVSFVGYGWVGGARAITQLRSLLTSFLKAEPVETEANLAFTKEIDLEGNILDQDAVSTSIKEVLDSLK